MFCWCTVVVIASTKDCKTRPKQPGSLQETAQRGTEMGVNFAAVLTRQNQCSSWVMHYGRIAEFGRIWENDKLDSKTPFSTFPDWKPCSK